MTLPRVLGDFIESHLAGLRVALPGRVVAYDKDTQRADIQPDIQDGYLDEDAQRQAVALPVITDVPVQFLGAGPFRITFPIRKGDQVLLIFSSSSLSRWKAAGGGLVDPGNDQRHTLEDAIAIPGCYAKPPTEAPDDAIVIHGDDVRLGGPDADDPVVRKSDLDAVIDEYVAHTHPAPGGATSAPATGAAFDSARPSCSPVVSSK